MQKSPMSLFPLLAAVLLLMPSVAWAKKEPYTGPCTESVSSAVATSEGVQLLFPDFAINWWKKNAENHPGVCLSSKPNPATRNYLMVFSTSERYYSGLMPTTRTYTSTSSTMFNANGSATNQYGDYWNFTATGDAQTTTTTTVNENVPYKDRAVGLFVKTYDSTGRIIRSDGHLYRTRTGGDASNTFGYNMGSALSNINARGKMLNSALLAIENDQDSPLPAAQARPVASPSGGFEVVGEEDPSSNSQPRPPVEVSPKVVVVVGSTPPAAEIEVDGVFMGNTPSELSLDAGLRRIRLLKKGFLPYERTIQIAAGSKPSIAAELEPEK